MPRKPRIEYAGAVYHVLNRGNYRQDLFTVSGSTAAFERVLIDSCARFGWRLYAYVVLSNHFHLCLKTVDANLATGMQWLQSTLSWRACVVTTSTSQLLRSPILRNVMLYIANSRGQEGIAPRYRGRFAG